MIKYRAGPGMEESTEAESEQLYLGQLGKATQMRLRHTEQLSDLLRSHAGILWNQDLKNQVHLAPETRAAYWSATAFMCGNLDYPQFSTWLGIKASKQFNK